MNFGNVITEIPTAQTSYPRVCCVLKKETNCGNAIAEIGEEKKIVAIVAMPLSKMEGKKNSSCRNLGRN